MHTADTSWGPVNSQIASVCQWAAWRRCCLFILVRSCIPQQSRALSWHPRLISHVLSVSARHYGLVHSAQAIQLAWRPPRCESSDSICSAPEALKWSLRLLIKNSILVCWTVLILRLIKWVNLFTLLSGLLMLPGERTRLHFKATLLFWVDMFIFCIYFRCMQINPLCFA